MAGFAILTNLRNSLGTNRRLFGLVTIAILVLGFLWAGYYLYIEANTKASEQYRFRALDSHYEAIQGRFQNDLETYSSKSESNSDYEELKDFITARLKAVKDPISLHGEFDEYIITYNTDNEEIPASSFPHQTNFDLDSILIRDPLNLGISLTVPEKKSKKSTEKSPKYRLFAKRYTFTTPEEIYGEEVIITTSIYGLVKYSKYRQHTRQLDSWVITLLVAFLSLCLFGLPFFKMVFIAEDERLFSKDVIFAGISMLVGVPIILMVFLASYTYSREYYLEIPDRLASLSGAITQRFERENEAIVAQLQELNLDAYDKESLEIDQEGPEILEPKENDTLLKENFKFISKVAQDTSGTVAYHIKWIEFSNKSKVPKRLAKRRYYEEFEETNLWHTQNGTRYIMRPVVSVEDQSEEAVYMLRTQENDSAPFKVGSVRLKSVHDPLLPFGYQYAILNKEGDVWFHSEEGRSTLENFFKVSANFNDLKAGIEGRIGIGGLVRYRDDNHLFYTMPIPHTELSVVALYDLSLLRLQISEILSITSVAVLGAFLFIAFLTVLLLLRGGKRITLYKYQPFLFEFLTPTKRLKRIYLLLSILMGLGFLVGIIVCIYGQFRPSIAFVLAFLGIAWSALLVYHFLYRNAKEIKSLFHVKGLFFYGVILFLNGWFFYGAEDLGRSLALLLIGLQVLYVLCMPYNSTAQLNRFVLQGIRKLELRSGVSLRYCYLFFLFNWLLLGTIMPTLVFFHKAKAINEIIWVKTNQRYFGYVYLKKEQKLRNQLMPAAQLDFEQLYKDHIAQSDYLDKTFYDSYKEEVSWNLNDFVGTKRSMNFRDLLWKTRPIYDEKLRPFQALVFKAAADGSWKSDESAKEITFTIHSEAQKRENLIATYQKKEQEKKLKDTSREPLVLPENKRKGFSGVIQRMVGWSKWNSIFNCLFRWLGVILLLMGAIALLAFYVDRFFGFRFNYLQPDNFDKTPEDIAMLAQLLREEEANSGLFLLGLPFSGKKEFAKKLTKEAGYTSWISFSFFRLDGIAKDASVDEIIERLYNDHFEAPVKGKTLKNGISNWEAYEVFILENLEHNVNASHANHIKLRLIAHLISLRKRVILISEVYPSQILGAYKNQKEDQESTTGTLDSDFNSWRNILSAFPQFVIGLANSRALIKNKINLEEQQQKHKASEQEPRILERLQDELGYSNFLPTLAPLVLTNNTHSKKYAKRSILRLNDQSMIMHTQNLAHGYYTDIWNSLPTRERYMLYDLAKDGFLNVKNINSLFSLMKKGLVVWKDRPLIFNLSFKNFVVSSVSVNEALRLENKNRGEGSWGAMRIVFYLIIITVISLISLGEPGILNDFETFIGAIGGMGVIIPLISSLLAQGTQK